LFFYLKRGGEKRTEGSERWDGIRERERGVTAKNEKAEEEEKHEEILSIYDV
jgi:hypothetical protein